MDLCPGEFKSVEGIFKDNLGHSLFVGSNLYMTYHILENL